ncbi:aminotransferase class V-fold PLP-dependent enzyme [Salmonella enterica]|nr:aminotransferase class V-fold PLP-dependent enzyme [Salmonella enterica subsp. enterica]ELC5005104.1 aminotransferase class V-fold PLP-dependent enzyme [Salmonella enterica]
MLTTLHSLDTKIVNYDEIKKVISKNTVLVSVASSNTDVGFITSVTEIREVCHWQDVILHVDAVP